MGLSNKTQLQAAAVVTACFAGTLLTAGNAHAGIYLTLRPVTATLPTNTIVTGNDLTGYSITLPTSTLTQSFSYDLVVRITDGTSNTQLGARALSTLYGAVRTTSLGPVTGGHVPLTPAERQVQNYDSPAPVFLLNPTGDINGSGANTINPATISAASPGTAAPFNYGLGANGTTVGSNTPPALLGVGPQFGNFSKPVSIAPPTTTTAFAMTFSYGGPEGLDPLALAANDDVVVARAKFQISNNNVDSTGSLKFVGGNGANGDPADLLTRWAQWYEEGFAYSTNNFNPASTFAVLNALNINFALYADINLDHKVDSLDIGEILNNFGNRGNNLPQDLNHDGKVDSLDIGEILNNFGNRAASGLSRNEPAATAAPIPEPTALPLLALTAAATLRRRRQAR